MAVPWERLTIPVFTSVVLAAVALKAAGINKERVVKAKREVLVCAAIIHKVRTPCKCALNINLPVALKDCSERPIPPNKKQQPRT